VSTGSGPDADVETAKAAGSEMGDVARPPTSPQAASPGRHEKPSSGIIFIDDRTFTRDCISRSLDGASADMEVLPFASVAACSSAPRQAGAIVLFNIHQRRITDADVDNDLVLLEQIFPSTPIVVLSDVDGVDRILAALARGIRGYILTSAPLGVAVEAIRLVRAGGTFVPASSLAASAGLKAGVGADDESEFTPRQIAVLRQLRMGRSNKTIAHELEMSESTVKAHVRNLMKKLSATNRTEVVCLTQALFEGETLPPRSHGKAAK